MSGQLDITVEQGATYRRVITITDSAGDPINIYNDTFAGQVRTNYHSENPSATFSFSLLTNGTDGKVVIELTDTQTSAIPGGKNVYDVEWTQSDGTVHRLLEGTAEVTQEVTK